ncbi:hypothetical protein [Mycolicibacterium sp. CBMA 234]|uniref:hypothetical protein n=1 Tax=Mycolicibacterium sp. CBMA 234 TaxID=1918495 RepID=UPI0012DCFFA6|nr:hypothetical protein [Mycolicibacterium sp. CBMA 234]
MSDIPAGIPESFAYYRNRDRPEFATMRRGCRLLVRGPLELSDDVVAGLGR